MYRYIYLYIIIYILSRARASVCERVWVRERAYVRVGTLSLSVLPYSASHTKLAYFLKFVDKLAGDFDTFIYLFV